MVKQLNTFVTVHDEEHGSHTFGPGDKLPGWAKKAITNPNVWDESGGTDDDSGSEGSNGSDGASTPGSDESAAGGSTGSENNGSEIVPPPLVGAGSGTEVWREYAAKATEAAGLKLDIADDAKRGDIVEALKSAGIPTA